MHESVHLQLKVFRLGPRDWIRLINPWMMCDDDPLEDEEQCSQPLGRRRAFLRYILKGPSIQLNSLFEGYSVGKGISLMA
jgi:hypothetical protein